MVTYDLAEAAQRAGTDPESMGRLVELGIVRPDGDGRYGPGDVRRVGLVQSLVAAGISLDGLAAAIRNGQVSLAFLDAPAFERFSALSELTFAQAAERTGVPIDLLMLIREAAGLPAPSPDDPVRDEELRYVDVIEAAIAGGFDPPNVQRLMRVHGESMRRIAETEIGHLAGRGDHAGASGGQATGRDPGQRVRRSRERAHGARRRRHVPPAAGTGLDEWHHRGTRGGARRGRPAQPAGTSAGDVLPGHHRLHQTDRGARRCRGRRQLADELGRLVQRTSVKHGGRPVKWLGDGVMLLFPRPGPGVEAALEMVAGVSEAGLPPAHVGLHAGPVIFQQGDYYGQTVNMASRIADYARPGEVLVTQSVVDASAGASVRFREIGPVELKGVAGTTLLFESLVPGG